MELITNILIEYLKHNKRIVVPKLGAFIVKQPSGVIIFSELMRGDDGVLRSLLMAYGVKELEANGMIDRLVFDVHHAINRGERFTIEGLGDFVASDNNTIIFKHKREPIVIGGNVKPPVEMLTIEKQKLQRSSEQRTPQGATSRSAATEPRKRSSQARRGHSEEAVDSLTITKPDAYLRGLKYDKSNNKRRGDERNDNKYNKKPSIFVILIITLIAGCVVLGGWLWLKADGGEVTYFNLDRKVATEPTIEQDSTTTDALTGADITLESSNMGAVVSSNESESKSESEITVTK